MICIQSYRYYPILLNLFSFSLLLSTHVSLFCCFYIARLTFLCFLQSKETRKVRKTGKKKIKG